ncbi:uncharacterized protein LOC121633429 isoform X2 [Melanotaenia boesemani]|uniref:uncharacterized protein LOC121633429 isoform X2 n=1 Tax=Melanotaenia boesemani TaxID=1250792 RepID=UPI001C044D8E|nr:uncharacterized protein LOC121633429 isoform X2 [Melanotaenia boesemani]
MCLWFSMNTVVFIFGLALSCCGFTEGKPRGQLEGFVQYECRDRYLWIRVASAQTPRFEAVDGNEVHSISEQLASRCGYTISSFNMDGFTSFRASFYSCFTHNQNDEVFTFSFNVMVSDSSSRWTSQTVSAMCSGLSWTHREITCEENYMEVNVNRESKCGGQRGAGEQAWQEAIFQAQKKASLAWQLMFLKSDGQVSSMSIPEAQKWGYSLTVTTKRVVLRSPYNQPHAEVMMVDGIPVETIQVSLFFKQKLLVVMMDMSMACTVNSGSYDGARLLWDIPRVLPPVVGEGAEFDSLSFSLGLDGVLLDEPTTTSRGLSLIQQGALVKIGVPFGTEGGSRKSLVVQNMYKEMYMILVLYEHVFSLTYEDGSSLDTKLRMMKVLETPLICRQPFSLNQTISDDQKFRIYLGNIPADVILEEVWINGKQLLTFEKPTRGLSISPIVHGNGSRAYELQLPFSDAAVRWMNVGGGVLRYYIDTNFTLTIMPQRQSYYHHTVITAQVFNAFPPEITAQCLDGGISFSVVRQSQSLWEVGIDQEPLTTQLVAQRGYRLHNDDHKTILEVPIFSVGYTYEEINLSNFYATFKLLLRDSKTLEVQASTSKRCLFRTQDMTVCSGDGTVTVVTTPTVTWPMVKPERTSLLDRSCRPKQTDGSRVLFEFKVDSCGTRATSGDWYMVYENEILHDRLLIADGPNFISRESQFKVTVRCFYPLGAVNRLSVDRRFTSAPGFGSINVFESQKDSVNKQCSLQGSENTLNAPPNQHHPNPDAGGTKHQPKPGQNHFMVPGGSSNLFPPQHLPNQETPAHHTPELPGGRMQWVHLNTPSKNIVEGSGTPGLQRQEYPTLETWGRIPDPPVGKQQQGSLSQMLESTNNLNQGVWYSGPTWEQSVSDQNKDQERLQVYPFVNMPDLSQPPESKPVSSLHGLLGGGGKMSSEVERPVFQVQSLHKPPETPQLYLQPDDAKQTLSTTTVPDWSEFLQESLSNRPTSDLQNPDKNWPVGRRNAQSKVQNVKVKPPSKFVSAAPHLNQKPVVKEATFQSSQYATDLTADSGTRTHWTAMQTPEHRGSATTGKTVPEVSPSAQEQGLHRPYVKPDQSASTTEQSQTWAGLQQMLEHLSPTRTGLQQKPVQHLAETGNGKIKLVSSQRDVHPVAVKHQTKNQSAVWQHPESVSKAEASRLLDDSFVDPSPTKTRVHNPTTKRPGFTSQTDPDGSDNSDMNIQSKQDCRESGQRGASVNQGIVRGKRIS